MNIPQLAVGWIHHAGFREVDLLTGQVDFEWYSSDEISPSESSYPIDLEAMRGPWPRGWNFFHPNSIDKSLEGDYMSVYHRSLPVSNDKSR